MKTALEFLKLRPRYFFAIAAITAFLLYADADFLKRTGVAEFAEDYRKYVGVVFLVSSILFFFGVADWIQKRLARNRAITAIRGDIEQRLYSLTEEEKQILRYYILKQTRTNYLNALDGVVQGLVAAGIIFRAINYGNPAAMPYNLTDPAWEYLQANEHILLGDTNWARTDAGKTLLDVLHPERQQYRF